MTKLEIILSILLVLFIGAYFITTKLLFDEKDYSIRSQEQMKELREECEELEEELDKLKGE